MRCMAGGRGWRGAEIPYTGILILKCCGKNIFTKLCYGSPLQKTHEGSKSVMVFFQPNYKIYNDSKRR